MIRIGTCAPKSSLAIRRSKIGIGFECLERQMWEDSDELYRFTGELGVKHARVQTGWFRCETIMGVYDFAWLEVVVDKLRALGVQPWFNVGYGNMLYTDSPHPDSAGYPPIYTPEAREAWCRFVRALVSYFRGRVTHYEIWNEPDASGFWKRGVNEDEYMDLVKLTAPVIRAENPDAKVMGGALAISIAWANAYPTIKRYLTLGITDQIDIFTYHRYHIMPELNGPDDFATLRELFDRHGGKHVELWQAESGCPSKPSSTEALGNIPVNENVQAKVALRSIMNDLLYGVDYTSYFHISDFKYYYRDGLIDVQNYFGLLTFDSPPRRKPSYYAVQCLCSLFDEDTKLDRSMKLTIDKKVVPDNERFTFQKKLIAIKKGMFDRKGYPLAVWWLPEDIVPEVAGNPPYEGEEILLKIWAYNLNIKTPVVIDPMTGAAYGFTDNEIFTERRGIGEPLPVFSGAMLKDYPLIATDYEAVAEMITPCPRIS